MDLQGADWDSAWRQVLTQANWTPLHSLPPGPPLLRGLQTAANLLTQRDFQPTLVTRFHTYLELIPLIMSGAEDDLEAIEAFVSTLLRQTHLPAFLYGLFWLRAVLCVEDESSRLGFVTQVKTEMGKVAAAIRSQMATDNALFRYALMLVTSVKPCEGSQVLEDFSVRREYCVVCVLSEYLQVSTGTFQRLLGQVTPLSPPELYTAVLRAVGGSHQQLLPSDLLKVAPAWIGFVGKLWRTYPSKSIPPAQIPPLITYFRVRSFLPLDPLLADPEFKATQAAFTLLNSSFPLSSPQFYLELASILPSFSHMDSLPRLIPSIGQLISHIFDYNNEFIHVKALFSLKELVENVSENIDISSLIPQKYIEEIQGFFETGKIGVEESEERVVKGLGKFVEEETREGSWREILREVRQVRERVAGTAGQIADEAVRREVWEVVEEILHLLKK